MKLTSIEIHPANSDDMVELSFRDPTANNPYNVLAIDGLGADQIVPRFYGTSGGAKFFNMSLEKRDIIAKIALNPSVLEEFSDLRDGLYRLISSSRTGKIQLQFKYGSIVVAAVSGFVSKFETAHFEKNQGVQITIGCDDPMLRAVDPTSVVLTDLDPFDTLIQDLNSNAPHGLSFEMQINLNIASLTITDPTDASWHFLVTPAGGFLAGDVLFFSSEYNNRYIYIMRSAAKIFLADAISPGSVWPVIFPGDNHLSFTHSANLGWNAISYYATYWGV